MLADLLLRAAKAASADQRLACSFVCASILHMALLCATHLARTGGSDVTEVRQATRPSRLSKRPVALPPAKQGLLSTRTLCFFVEHSPAAPPRSCWPSALTSYRSLQQLGGASLMAHAVAAPHPNCSSRQLQPQQSWSRRLLRCRGNPPPHLLCALSSCSSCCLPLSVWRHWSASTRRFLSRRMRRNMSLQLQQQAAAAPTYAAPTCKLRAAQRRGRVLAACAAGGAGGNAHVHAGNGGQFSCMRCHDVRAVC